MNLIYDFIGLLFILNVFLFGYLIKLRFDIRELKTSVNDDNEDNVEYLNIRLDELREEMKNYRREMTTKYSNFFASYTMNQRVRLDKLLTRLENEINKGNVGRAYKMVKRFRRIKKFKP